MAEPFQLFEKPLLKYSWVVRFGYALRLLMYKWRLCPAPSYEWSEIRFLGSLWPSLASVYLCAQLDLSWPDLTLHDDLWGYYCFLANNCWLKQDTSFKVVPMYSAQHGESVDMQHDLLESGHDLELRSRLVFDLFRSNYASFEVERRDDQIGTSRRPTHLPVIRYSSIKCIYGRQLIIQRSYMVKIANI